MSNTKRYGDIIDISHEWDAVINGTIALTAFCWIMLGKVGKFRPHYLINKDITLLALKFAKTAELSGAGENVRDMVEDLLCELFDLGDMTVEARGRYDRRFFQVIVGRETWVCTG